MIRSIFFGLLYVISVTAAFFTNAPAQAGTLDSTFGTGGTTLVSFPFIVPAPDGVVTQSDGKIVSISGGFSSGHKLVRLNADGSLDTTFGGDGSVEFTWVLGSSYGKAYGIALQNISGQERIVVAGSGYIQSGRSVVGGLEAERFMPDGSVDTSFGNNGTVVYNTGYALTVAVQPDGKIITVGDAGKLVRLNPNGSLDTSFGSNGVVTVPSSRALAVDAAGGVLVGGAKTIGKGNSARSAMAVFRYLSNGVADTSFGSSGVATADFGVDSQLWELQIDLSGNIVAGGHAGSAFAVARFTSAGRPDTTFNGTGRAVGPSGDGRGTAVQLDGKVVVTGQYNNDFRLARFNADGTVDSTFGTGGVVTINVYGNDYSNKTVMQVDPNCNCEKIVMSGGSNPNISFARFNTF